MSMSDLHVSGMDHNGFPGFAPQKFVRKKHCESGESSMLSANSDKLANPPFVRNSTRESLHGS